jgi:two-component system response regulator HydG
VSGPAAVLVVEDDDAMRLLLEEELAEAGYRVRTAAGGHEALAALQSDPPDLVVSDLVMPAMRGDELLLEVRARRPEVPVILITAHGSIESAVSAVKAGAYHYVVKPFPMQQLLTTVANALRERSLQAEIRTLRSILGTGVATIVAESPAMQAALDMVRRAAAADSAVLLLGESGTGKELLARALHAGSARRDGPFIAVNCSAIPDTLLESQLFGHRRGAFTDAREDRRGLFQAASGGTILLDEVGDMPPGLQSKLLRVLQEREIHPIGAPAPIPVDVRVVAATHCDLEARIEQDRFRQDLYYRLNVIAVRIPPLRERPADIVPLVAHFLEKHGRRLGRAACSVSPRALEALRRYAWPGNVRELENAIERALVLGRDDVIWPEDLPEAVRAPRPAQVLATGDTRPLVEVEREHIARTLRAVRWNKAAAARRLGMDRKTLYRKIEQHGLRQA